MKKLLLTFLLMAGIAEAQVVNIPDANFKTKLLAADVNNNIATSTSNMPMKIDANNDGQIQLSEAQLVRTLNVGSSGISNMSGIENFTSVFFLFCDNNLFATVDVSDLINLCLFHCQNNPNLEAVFIKNGSSLCVFESDFTNTPNLRYLCTDENKIADFITFFASNSITGVNVNSYCSFTPGGNYNTIKGTVKFDANNNGCDAGDFTFPYIRLGINDGTIQGSTINDAVGNYAFHTQVGTFTITPQIENLTFFTINPANAVVNFPLLNNSVSTNNFCITANGVHPDLEIVIAPVAPARPGFDAVYKIVYKNKGNQVMSQPYGINFFYNHNLMSFISATIPVGTQNLGSLSWDYANLQPFESRSIELTLRINPPTHSNPVNIDDVLTFTASILPAAGDENNTDNLFQLNQIVRGSYDPNDIQCLEGDVVPPSEIGDYLHYLIRFENTGNESAENIVVKDVIDATKYDISSIQILNSSHQVNTRIQGNTAEFIFQGINLYSGGHGNILLKLKSRNNLATGDVVSNRANIYFDYNFPVGTNDANTTFQALSIGEHELDNSIKVYPNPTAGFVSVKSDGTIRSIQMYDAHGRILLTRLIEDKSTNLDLSAYATGLYYLKVITDKGAKAEKLIKK